MALTRRRFHAEREDMKLVKYSLMFVLTVFISCDSDDEDHHHHHEPNMAQSYRWRQDLRCERQVCLSFAISSLLPELQQQSILKQIIEN
jgi:hypothetical protein